MNQQVQAKLELKEKEIARRYKMQAAKDKTQFREQLTAEFESKKSAMSSRLDAKMAEVAQLKSIMQVKLKKLNEQKNEMEMCLTRELKSAQVHTLTQQLVKKEKVVRNLETQ